MTAEEWQQKPVNIKITREARLAETTRNARQVLMRGLRGAEGLMQIVWHWGKCGSSFDRRADCRESGTGGCNQDTAENLPHGFPEKKKKSQNKTQLQRAQTSSNGQNHNTFLLIVCFFYCK